MNRLLISFLCASVMTGCFAEDAETPTAEVAQDDTTTPKEGTTTPEEDAEPMDGRPAKTVGGTVSIQTATLVIPPDASSQETLNAPLETAKQRRPWWSSVRMG